MSRVFLAVNLSKQQKREDSSERSKSQMGIIRMSHVFVELTTVAAAAEGRVLPMKPPSPRRLWCKSKRAIGPDEGARVSLLWRRKAAVVESQPETQGPEVMTTLPHDVLIAVFSFLPVSDVDGSVKLVCKSLK